MGEVLLVERQVERQVELQVVLREGAGGVTATMGSQRPPARTRATQRKKHEEQNGGAMLHNISKAF